jgi:hypothetical protein
MLHVNGILYWTIRTYNPDTLVLKDADSTPTVAVQKNGSSTGDSVTVTKRSATTGIYDCSYNPASEVEGDEFVIEETATITGTTTAQATYSQSWSFTVIAVERGSDTAPDNASITAIKAKTDNLPSDPADASEMATSFSTVNSTLTTIATYIDTEVAAIKAKTDNLPTDPADQSAVEAAITSAVTAIKGADGDTLKSLSDQIDGLSASTGSGARTVTITVNDGTTVLQNAKVRLTEGASTYNGTTNASGVIVFNVDDATYTVGITKSGYTYAGTSLVVDGTETRTYSMTVVSVTPPDDPALCAVTMHVYDQYGADMASQPVEITFVKWETTATDTPPVLSPPPVLSTNTEGIVSAELFREATYKIVYGNAPYTRRVDVTIPDAATYTVEL